MCGPMTVLLSLCRFINPLQKALAISTEETKTYSTEKSTGQSMRIWAVWEFPVRATATLSLNACVDAGSSDIFHSSSKVRRLSFGPCSFKFNPTHAGRAAITERPPFPPADRLVHRLQTVPPPLAPAATGRMSCRSCVDYPDQI